MTLTPKEQSRAHAVGTAARQDYADFRQHGWTSKECVMYAFTILLASYGDAGHDFKPGDGVASLNAFMDRIKITDLP